MTTYGAQGVPQRTAPPLGRPVHSGHTAVRTMLVDDHALLREGIRSLLEREQAISVVGEADSFDAALAEIARCRPDVVVVDLKLSAGTEYEGLRLVTELTSRYPKVATLVLTTFLDDDLVVRAVKAGARGYVVKDVDTTAPSRLCGEVVVPSTPAAPQSCCGRYRVRPMHPTRSPTGSVRCCGYWQTVCPTRESGRNSSSPSPR